MTRHPGPRTIVDIPAGVKHWHAAALPEDSNTDEVEYCYNDYAEGRHKRVR